MMEPVDLAVGDTLYTAWQKVYGAKKTFWAALGLLFLINLGLSALNKILSGIPGTAIIMWIISFIVILLLQIGILYMGILRARNSPIQYQMLFYAFRFEVAIRAIGYYLLKIVILGLPIFISLQLGFLFSLLGAVVSFYLFIRLFLGFGFILDKEMNPLQAIKSSFKATQANFWNLFAIGILQFLIFAISVIPLGIGLIWTLPFVFILYGMIYQKLLPNLGLEGYL